MNEIRTLRGVDVAFFGLRQPRSSAETRRLGRELLARPKTVLIRSATDAVAARPSAVAAALGGRKLVWCRAYPTVALLVYGSLIPHHASSAPALFNLER